MQIGARVFALRDTTEEAVNLYGYGEFKGSKVPDDNDIEIAPDRVKPMLELIKEAGIGNPLIALEDGTNVWGCTCWFAKAGSTHKEKYFGDREIVIVPYE